MKKKIFCLLIMAWVASACNVVENDSTSATMLQVVSMTGRDLEGKDGSTTVFSDVVTSDSIINDNGVAEISAKPIDPMATTIQLTSYLDVLVDQIDVEFKRTDGRNVEGIDVPYRFTQPVSVKVAINATGKIPFILIRHVAKLEAPLLALREILNQGKVLELVAVITIHGVDMGGHRVAPVTGYITVWCSNFADQDAPTEPQG